MGNTLSSGVLLGIVFFVLCLCYALLELFFGLMKKNSKDTDNQSAECKDSIEIDVHIGKNVYHISIPKTIIVRKENKPEGSNEGVYEQK